MAVRPAGAGSDRVLAVPNAELVYANVLDLRVYGAEGPGGAPVVYAFGVPSRPLPFVVIRHWKAPQGMVTEHFEILAPSGRITYRSPLVPRRMPGQMDLLELIDRPEDAVFEEVGVHVASFLVDEEVQGQIEFQLVLQLPPTKLPKEYEDAFRKTDVIWVGVEQDGRDVAVPVWFVYKDGRVYLLHSNDAGSGEQRVPGAPEATDLLVVTRHKYRDTSSNRFHATCRVVTTDDPDFAPLAAMLADRRRDRHGPPAEAIARWRKSCVILELTPTIP
jgi:hypothetical protein